MSPEVALLNELWTAVASHVHEKERFELCEQIVTMFEDTVGLDDLDVYKNEFDSIMKEVIIARSEDEEVDEEEDWDY